MLFFKHRINTSEELKNVPKNMGVELDIRYEGRKLILHHDAFTTGEDFESYLKNYQHAGMILNVKSEGIEEAILELMQKYHIENYFFLDVSFPALIKLHRTGISKTAIRFSEYEPIEQCMALKNIVQWVWVDCFDYCPLTKENHTQLKKYFKICLVSPELQKHPLERIEEFKKQLDGLEIDAICTKRPELWQNSI